VRAAVLATLALLAPAARADESVRAAEAERARLLDHRWPLPVPVEGARLKADDTGDYDLQAVAIELEGGAPGGLPVDARFEVSMVARRRLEGAVVLLAAFFEPVAVRSAEGEALEFRRDPGSGELLVSLPRAFDAQEVVRLTIEAPFTPACADASGCRAEGALRHVVEYGWYPMSGEFPLGDRFGVELTVSAPGDETPSAMGLRVSDRVEGPRRVVRFATEQRTTLVAYAQGPYVTRLVDGGPAPVELLVPPAAADGGEPMGALAVDAMRAFEALFGPYPFRRLAVTPIDDAAGVGIGPQANIFLREREWATSPRDPRYEVVRRVASHEIAHQYFANHVGIADSRDLWLSEGFAEFAATHYSERLTGTDEHFRTNYWAYLQRVPAVGDSPLWSTDTFDGPYRFEIAYQKGGAVLELLRRRLGAGEFDRVMAAYVAAFAGGIATTPELVDFWVANAGEPLRAFFDEWVFGEGHPELRVSAAPARGANDAVSLRIAAAPDRFSGPVPLRMHLADGSTDTVTVRLEDGPEYRLRAGPVQWIEVDPALTLFRRVRPDPAGDVDLSGVVDGMDLLDVYFAQGRESPDPAWDDRVDVNRDGAVDAFDLRAVREAFGEGW
jgi:hypothetical protein